MTSSDQTPRNENAENRNGANDVNPEAAAPQEDAQEANAEAPDASEGTEAPSSEATEAPAPNSSEDTEVTETPEASSTDSPTAETPSAESTAAGASPADAPTRVSVKDKLGAFASSMSPKKHLHLKTRGRKISAAALAGLILLGGGTAIAHEIYEDHGGRGFHAEYREHRPERGGAPGHSLNGPHGGPGADRWDDNRWDDDRWDDDRWDHDDRFDLDDRFGLDDRYDRDDCWDDDRYERWDDDRLERELMERERTQNAPRK